MISELDNKSNLYIILDKVNLKYLQVFIQMKNLMANKLLKLNLVAKTFQDIYVDGNRSDSPIFYKRSFCIILRIMVKYG